MTKIEAMNELLDGKCDAIRHKSSIYIAHDDSIINKRSKKPLDAKSLHEEEWEIIVEPKWYDDLENGPIMCWVNDGDVCLIVKMTDDGDFVNNFGDVFGDSFGVVPVSTQDNILNYVYDSKERKKLRQKDEPIATVEKKEEVEVTENKGKQEECQSETLENTASQKVVTTNGVPALVAENKNYFVELGLPEEFWGEFWMLNNFDSITILEAIEKGDEYCKGLISSYLSNRAEEDNEEIPF